ncbi:hypothetical protein C8J56DRAFT_889406 [Mycena floridula]|nr:hypothetical protein C8J56DRAFT_889406 [Mycena floridula]
MVHGHKWGALEGLGEDLAGDPMEYIDLEEPVGHKEMVLFWLNAERDNLLSGLDPYWFQWNTPWRCFIPVSLVGEGESPWFLQMGYDDIDSLVEEHAGRFRLSDNFLTETKEAFKTIKDIAYSFLNHSIFREPLMRTPEPAFPRWRENRNGLSDQTFKRVESLKLEGYGMRGIMTEIPRDYLLLNFPLFIENDVPVYFPLMPGFLSDPRFASLDPELYKEYQEEARHREGEVDIRDLPQYESRWRYIETYDEFLEKRMTVPASPFQYWPANAERKVVDFEEWGDRDCSIDELAFLRPKCPAEVTREESIGVEMKVIFKRWVNIDQDTHSLETLGRKGWKDFKDRKEFVADIEGPAFERRERFRGRCGPRLGERFNDVGKTITPPFNPDAGSLYTQLYQHYPNDCFVAMEENRSQ